MEEDLGRRLESLKVDGGVTVNGLCMQLQADILGIPVSKPLVAETTALGARTLPVAPSAFGRATKSAPELARGATMAPGLGPRASPGSL